MKKAAFICVHNSCRSQIAEALGKHLAADVFESYSAGTETKPQINQDAVRLMKQLYGIDMEQTQHSKLLADIPPVNIVITMGCNVTCPRLPCEHREDWGLDDPSGKSDIEFKKIIEIIRVKILDLSERIQAYCKMEGNRQMCDEFINLTAENFANEHLCCIIRSKKRHQGIEAKRQWLSERLKEGHTFRKLNAKGTVFIEYAPLETAWVPITGDNYYYIYCLWVLGDFKGKGYAKALMEYCLADAKQNGKSGVCMLGAQKQKAWLSDQSFAKKFGFEVVDTTDSGYELLALSFDGTAPRFTEKAKPCKIESKPLTIYYDMQCPYVFQNIETLKEYCTTHEIPSSFIQVDSLQKAKELPCVFNNWALFYNGKFETVNLLDVAHLKKILQK